MRFGNSHNGPSQLRIISTLPPFRNCPLPNKLYDVLQPGIYHENDLLEHSNCSSYIFYTYTHVTWSKKYIYFLKTITIYKIIKPKHRHHLRHGASTRIAKTTVKSMHMTRHHGGLQFHQNCGGMYFGLLIVRACVRACVRSSLLDIMYISQYYLYLSCVLCHILR